VTCVYLLLRQSTENLPTCNWSEQVRMTRKKYKYMSLLINIKLSMTTCEFMQINRQARNEKQHILKVTLTVVNSHRWFRRFPLNMVILNAVISTFPFKHGHPERLQFDGLKILHALGKIRPNLSCDCEQTETDLLFLKLRKRDQRTNRRYHYRGLERGASQFISR